MKDQLSSSIDLIKQLNEVRPKEVIPSTTSSRPSTEMVLNTAFVASTRGYIETVVDQINGCYEQGWFDACAVMIRKVLETLIIECFEAYGRQTEIQDVSGNYHFLSVLISKFERETSWTSSRNSRDSLKKLKLLGDLSAHNRRFIAHRSDIDKVTFDFRIVVQELLTISRLK